MDVDTLTPEMCLRQTGFMYSTCRPLKNNKAGIQRFKKTEDIRYTYHSGSDNVCFQHDLAYGAHKYLPRKLNFNKKSVIENFQLIVILSIMHINQKLPQLSINFMTKNLETVSINISDDQHLPNELCRLITGKFNTHRIYSCFVDIVWSPDLADMQLIRKYNKGVRSLLCDIETCRKYPWVALLKDKKGIKVTNNFQKFLDESDRKPNKMGRLV